MDCRTVKDRLMRSEPGGEDAAADLEHMEACADCALFARRLALVREAFRQPAAVTIEPDACFALRVLERLPRPTEVLGWAALRALPAAVVLVIALLWIGVSQPVLSESLSDSLFDTASPDIVLTYTALAPETGP